MSKIEGSTVVETPEHINVIMGIKTIHPAQLSGSIPDRIISLERKPTGRIGDVIITENPRKETLHLCCNSNLRNLPGLTGLSIQLGERKISPEEKFLFIYMIEVITKGPEYTQ
jgi:hypothetical protein